MADDLSGGAGTGGSGGLSTSTGNAALDGSISGPLSRLQDGALAVSAIGLGILILLAIIAIFLKTRKALEKDDVETPENDECVHCGGEGPLNEEGLCQGCETVLSEEDYGYCDKCGAYGPVIAVDASDYRECFSGCENHGE